MPQIFSNFTLDSKLPNFSRDQMTKEQMTNITDAHIDNGHITYCTDDNTHYIYTGNGVGFNRWVRFSGLHKIDSRADLNDELAKSLELGKLIFVDDLENNFHQIFINTYPTKFEYLEDTTGYFYPLLTSEYLTDILEKYATKTDLSNELNNYTTSSDLDKKLKDYATNESVTDLLQNYPTNDDLIDTLKDYATKTDLSNELNNYTTSSDLDKKLKDYATNESVTDLLQNYPTNDNLTDTLKDYAKIGSIESMLDDYVQIKDLPALDASKYATKDELNSVENLAIGATKSSGQVQQNLDDYKSQADSKYASKNELKTYVQGSTFQNEMNITGDRISNLENKLGSFSSDLTIGSALDNKVETSVFEDYKKEVEDTYAKPEDISSLLNTYAPNIEYNKKWIANEWAGELTGKTGEEIAKEGYSYNEVFDQMFFGDYTPTATEPSITVAIKPTWQNGVTFEWYDIENRIIMLPAGSYGPDGSDFIAENIINSVISYPKNLKLGTLHTNNLIPSTDEKQTTTGFCKIKNENGEWVYYGQEDNIYHVPGTPLEPGEYRYYIAAYFQKGSPIQNNKGQTIKEWDETKAIESKDYITIKVSKPTSYMTKDGWKENPLSIWNEKSMVDYMELAPSCQVDQMFRVPRKLKALYIWNGIAGDYAEVPMMINNKVPAYFDEIESGDYYTYKYNSDEYGHRGAIKIKVIF